MFRISGVPPASTRKTRRQAAGIAREDDQPALFIQMSTQARKESGDIIEVFDHVEGRYQTRPGGVFGSETAISA